MTRTRLLALVLTMAAVFPMPRNVVASERILDFTSTITVRTDATLEVTETISVMADGKKIRHGIYRDFPTDYQDVHGNRVRTGFDVRSVTQDKLMATYRVERLSNGVRVKIGSPKRLIEPGAHEYSIRYTTHRQLGFFPDHDELYWNVTGNGWEFPINAASVVVKLPPGASEQITFIKTYIGPQGSAESGSVTRRRTFDGHVRLILGDKLLAREGFTIALGWAKGFVVKPDWWQGLRWFVADNAETSVLTAGLVALFVYYLAVWFLVGRDPSGRTVIPLFAPPNKFSPAGTRCVSRLGDCDRRTMVAAIVNLAVQGWLTIEVDGSGVFSLEKTGDENGELALEELQLYHSLFNGISEVYLNNNYADIFQQAFNNLKKCLDTGYATTFFHRNTFYSVVGHAITVLLYFLAIGFYSWKHIAISTLSLPLIYFAVKTLWRWRDVFLMLRQSSGFRLIKNAAWIFLGVPLVGAFSLLLLSRVLPHAVTALMVVLVSVNVVFLDLIKAPTKLGRLMIDQIEGLRMYLGTAEKSYLNAMTPPEKTPELFEKFLPFAIALEVENAWAEKFTGIMEKASMSPANPKIWHVRNMHGGLGFVSSFSDSMTTTISSASVPPGKLSGGDGGFSGGGGGGGGGGGW